MKEFLKLHGAVDAADENSEADLRKLILQFSHGELLQGPAPRHDFQFSANIGIWRSMAAPGGSVFVNYRITITLLQTTDDNCGEAL